jgi:Flp pilus assembly protein TadB
VAEALRERRETAREVRALTAQARLSGAILGLLPIGFFLFLLLTSRSDIAAAFETPAGIAATGLGLLMQGVAFVWIRHLLRVA